MATDMTFDLRELPALAHASHLFLFLNLCLSEGNLGPVYDRSVMELQTFRNLLTRFHDPMRAANRLSPLDVLNELAKKQVSHVVKQISVMQQCVLAGDLLLQVVAQILTARERQAQSGPIKIDPKKLN